MLSTATALTGVALAMAGLVAPPYAGNLGTATYQGFATFTDDYKPDFNVVACPKSDRLPKLPKQFITGLNRPQFGKSDKSPNCGVTVEVTGPKGMLKVLIVDVAVGPKSGDLNLDRAGFAKIAKIDDGHVKISWKVATP
jgi:expansin (peptidoglycan-binding protein)